MAGAGTQIRLDGVGFLDKMPWKIKQGGHTDLLAWYISIMWMGILSPGHPRSNAKRKQGVETASLHSSPQAQYWWPSTLLWDSQDCHCHPFLSWLLISIWMRLWILVFSINVNFFLAIFSAKFWVTRYRRLFDLKNIRSIKGVDPCSRPHWVSDWAEIRQEPTRLRAWNGKESTVRKVAAVLGIWHFSLFSVQECSVPSLTGEGVNW